MYPFAAKELTRQVELDARRSGARGARLRAARRSGAAAARIAPQVDIVIRAAEVGDMPALIRLAELDSRPLPAGKLLVAEAGGLIRAAIGLNDRSVIADPFVPTAQLGALLTLRADQLERGNRRARRRAGLLDALRLRPRRAA